SQVREMTQHIVSIAAEFSTTCCVYRVWRCAEGEEDPELRVFGSAKTNTNKKHTIVYVFKKSMLRSI
ncbi:hypothetical protein, partial [Escherichia coli]|uniref:hypothetical protein n=1 Tax=Escherichia coli TaxID=562 RepID=UPI001BFCBB6F